MIRLVAFDIDGTLLPFGENELKKELLEAIFRLREKGIKTIVATGRCSYLIPRYILDALRSDYYITINGALLCDHDLKTLAMHPLSLEDVEKITTEAIKDDLAMSFKFERQIAVYHRYNDYFNNYTRGVGISLSPAELRNTIVDVTKDHDYHRQNKTLPLGAYVIGEPERVIKLKYRLTFVDTIMTAYGNSFECMQKGVSKATGLKDVAKLLKVDLKDTLAFGDGENDIEMLKSAGIGVAMGNASDKVKTKADLVTDDCKRDGIIKALKRLELI